MNDNQVNSIKFGSIGEDVIIWPLAKIVASEVISIGDSFVIDDYAFLMGGTDTRIGSFARRR